jgi:hypothetical protein
VKKKRREKEASRGPGRRRALCQCRPRGGWVVRRGAVEYGSPGGVPAALLPGTALVLISAGGRSAPIWEGREKACVPASGGRGGEKHARSGKTQASARVALVGGEQTPNQRRH